MRPLFFSALLLALSGCAPSGSDDAGAPPPPPESAVRPALDTAADTLAWRIVEAAGGLDAWYALPRLRFDFVTVRDSTEAFRARHLWDRQTGRYRVEYPVGEDSMLVALFNVQGFDLSAPEGAVFINGTPLDSAATRERLTEAYERHLNDSYWLLAPLKLFDPGVHRALAPDSARDGTEVLALSFEDVGMTPGDHYWMSADSTGRLVRWSYILEGGTHGTYAWRDPVSLPTPQGQLHLATSKRSASGREIRTLIFSAGGLPDDVFERPTPVL